MSEAMPIKSLAQTLWAFATLHIRPSLPQMVAPLNRLAAVAHEAVPQDISMWVGKGFLVFCFRGWGFFNTVYHGQSLLGACA
jgi:hypothetical protein